MTKKTKLIAMPLAITPMKPVDTYPRYYKDAPRDLCARDPDLKKAR
jgi:hypothetical protein